MTNEAVTSTPANAASRRRFITAAAAGGTAAIGFPAVVRVQAPIKWRVQTAWDAGTAGYTAFQKFCANVKVLSEGKLEFQPLPAGAIVGTFEMFDAVKGGVLDAMHVFTVYWSGRLPVTAPRIPWRWTGRTSGRRGSTSWGGSRSRERPTRPTTCSTWGRSSTT